MSETSGDYDVVADCLPLLARLRQSSVIADSGCIEWMKGLSQNGYGRLSVSGRPRFAHRLAWELANGRRVPDGLFVLHTCDNRRCINPEHLFVGTIADNVADMRAKGRGKDAPRGEEHWRAELTEDQVLQISNDPRPNAVIAAAHGVSRYAVNGIKLGRNWLWLTGWAEAEIRPMVKVSPEQVIAIRNDPRSQRAIAADYGICKSAVGYIKRRQNWKQL